MTFAAVTACPIFEHRPVRSFEHWPAVEHLEPEATSVVDHPVMAAAQQQEVR